MAMITRPTDKVMNVNIAYDDMMRPVLGPDNPFDSRKNKGMNSVAGGLSLLANTLRDWKSDETCYPQVTSRNNRWMPTPSCSNKEHSPCTAMP
jgi:hypothetical protein